MVTDAMRFSPLDNSEKNLLDSWVLSILFPALGDRLMAGRQSLDLSI